MSDENLVIYQRRTLIHDPGFYVSVIDGARYKLIAGPFATHAEALAQVETEREKWYHLDGRSHWYAWGTARVLALQGSSDEPSA